MTCEEWDAAEQEWWDLVRVRGAAEAAYRQALLARKELARACLVMERAARKADAAREACERACATAEEWMHFATSMRCESEVSW